jgi:hypothetical protein
MSDNPHLAQQFRNSQNYAVQHSTYRAPWKACEGCGKAVEKKGRLQPRFCSRKCHDEKLDPPRGVERSTDPRTKVDIVVSLPLPSPADPIPLSWTVEIMALGMFCGACQERGLVSTWAAWLDATLETRNEYRRAAWERAQTVPDLPLFPYNGMDYSLSFRDLPGVPRAE